MVSSRLYEIALDVSSVAHPDPGSGAFLTPGLGSGINLSRIPNPYF